MPKVKDRKKSARSSGRYIKMLPGYEHLKFLLNVHTGVIKYPNDVDESRLPVSLQPGEFRRISDEVGINIEVRYYPGQGYAWRFSFRTVGGARRG